MSTLPTPFPVPPPHCTFDAVYPRLLATVRDRPQPEQEAIFQAIGQLFRAIHEVSMFDARFRDWSEAHRISPESNACVVFIGTRARIFCNEPGDGVFQLYES
jgi:hypothetical protein